MGDDDENIEKLNEDGHEDKDRGEETDTDTDENDEIKSVKDENESAKDENELDKTEEKVKVFKSTLQRKKSPRKKDKFMIRIACIIIANVLFIINPILTERVSS